MKNFTFKLFIFCTCLFSDFAMFSQPGNNDNNGDLEGNDPPAAPINSKLIILAIVGLLFAIYIFKTRRKNAI